MFCKYCKKRGHLIDKCYKLHGFPSNFKFSKGRRFAANVSTEPDIDLMPSGAGSSYPGSSNSSSSEQNSVLPGLGMQQYNQLMSLLQQSHVSTSESQPNLIASANFVSTLVSADLCNSSSSNSCMLSQAVGLTWIIDSRATDHMISNKDFISNITPLPIPYLVSLPNG